MTEDFLDKLDKTERDFIDDIIYSKDENLFIRHARRKVFDETYGNIFLAPWIPGLFAYANIKKYANDTKITRKEKIIMYTGSISGELILSVFRVGAVYGTYELIVYLNNFINK